MNKTKILRCPGCGSEKFFCKIIHIGVANISTDGKISVYNVLEESEKSTSALAACMNQDCKYNGKGDVKLTLQDLVSTEKCSKCGNEYDSEELDENGVCSLCIAMERDDLKNASKEDLIRRVLQLERGNSTINSVEEKINNKIAKSQEVLEKAEHKAEEKNIAEKAKAEAMITAEDKKNSILAKADEVAAEKSASEEKTKPTTGKRAVKKKTPSAEPNVEPVANETTEKEEQPLVNDASVMPEELPEAPFPEVEEAPGPAINPPIPDVAPRFKMFEPEDESGSTSAF